jgi:hypothetical protein
VKWYRQAPAKLSRRAAIVGATAALIVGFSVAAYATIPDSSGVIHGCRKNSDGSVRVIDSDLGQTCASGWTALNWSQAGPQGPIGPTGPQGPTGPGVTYYVVDDPRTVSGGSVTTSTNCNEGDFAIGAGNALDPVKLRVTRFWPDPNSTRSWEIQVQNLDSPNPMSWEVRLVCAHLGS